MLDWLASLDTMGVFQRSGILAYLKILLLSNVKQNGVAIAYLLMLDI